MLNFGVIAPLLISFVISAAAGPEDHSESLRRLKAGQTVRDDGPQTHLKKTWDSYHGRYYFPAGVLWLPALFYVKDYPKIIPVLFMTVGFGIDRIFWMTILKWS